MRVSQKMLSNEIYQIEKYLNIRIIHDRLNNKITINNEEELKVKSNTEIMKILKPYHNLAVCMCIKKYGKCRW